MILTVLERRAPNGIGILANMAKPVTIPFSGQPNQRAIGTTDRRYVNVLHETVTDASTKTQELWVVKRPGLANSTQPPGGAAAGRGLYAWGATGKIYSVAANKIYSGVTDLGVTLAGSSGRAWFVETPANVSYAQTLVISDGADNYNITTADVITQIDEGDDADYPQANLGPICYLDEMLFQAQSDGDIWNTSVASYIAWSATSVKRTPRKGSALEAIISQRDQIVAFYKNYIDFYFNNGNPTGSPLLRHEQNGMDFGIASKATLAWSGSTVCFVGENASSGDGERSVWMISGIKKIGEISNAAINRFLRAEGSSISSATAWMERIAGQLVYVLNLSSANRTFVYNVDNPGWTEWEAAGGGKFNVIAVTSLNGVVYGQDASNGRIYTLLSTTFQDSSVDFTVTLQPAKTDLGTDNRKFETELSVVGDTTTGNLSVTYSDDDGANYSTARTIDLSQSHKRLMRMGSFRERIYRYTYADNYALRLQAARHDIEIGTN